MSDYFERVERQLVRQVETGRRRPRPLRLGSAAVYAASVAAVLVVVAVFLLARGGGSGPSAPAARGGATLVYTAAPRAGAAALARTVHILHERLHAAVRGVSVSRQGQQIVLRSARLSASARRELAALIAPGRLEFYDWEADVLTPNGRTVASQLAGHDPLALRISQGHGSSAPGEPGAGAVPLHQPLALIDQRGNRADQRYIVLQAVESSPIQSPGSSAGPARFYVLRNLPVLTGRDIRDPQEENEPGTGTPEVSFQFTDQGARLFKALTAEIARRGDLLSTPGQTLNQHFAVALDHQLITVPYVDFKQYPDGISGDDGANLLGDFTAQSARNLAILLRYGPLPVNLVAAG